MNRVDFQEIAELRLRESKALNAAGFSDGAYYLAGYAVECALKACIARRTEEHDFPEKTLVNESHTHNLKDLVRLALWKTELNVAVQADSLMDANWTIIQNWSETSRYQKKTTQQPTALLQAIDDRPGGLLPWVRQRW
jgi:HEPN domain-containing protein